jgi:hypothetical protein
MSEQSKRISSEVRKSNLLSVRFEVMAGRVLQLRDSQFGVLDVYEEKTLMNIEQCLMALSKARVGTR